MDIRQLTPRYYVSPQIDPSDMEGLKEAGITHILCNRPDAEVPPSHRSAEIARAAEAAGLSFSFCPLTHQTMVPEVIADNRAKGVERDDVVLAYCASGTRSTIAWALGQAGNEPADKLVSSAADAGYDLSQMRGLLERPFG